MSGFFLRGMSMRSKSKISPVARLWFRRPVGWLKTKSGFTLTEVLVSMLVLAVGCMAVISMQASGMNAGDRAASMSVASFLAEAQIERLQTKPIEEVKSVPPDEKGLIEKLTKDGSPCPANAQADSCFTRTTKTVCFTPTTRSCEVSVQVDWQAADGQHSVVYDTVVSAAGF